MLTADLVRVRKKEGLIHAQYVRRDAWARLLPIAAAFVETVRAMVGQRRDDIDAALDAIVVPARDRVAALGLRKVIEDRSEYEVALDVDPEGIRRELFLAAADAHRSLDVGALFDRDAVIAGVAARLKTTPEALEAGLYADLRGSEILRAFAVLGPELLLDRYNLALAQSILLRATRVEVRVVGETPHRYRQLFRAARFHGLLHVVRGDPASGYTITLDGPFSLFDAVQRYGLRLAMFLPSVLLCDRFDVRADVLWGRAREPSVFAISQDDKLASHAMEPISTSPELTAFCEAFNRIGAEWKVEANERIFALPGEVVCVPDLVFTSSSTGEEVFLEAFGFWSRAAVWSRVELLRRGFPARLLLAVSKHLRVSEEVLGDDDAGEIYVYRSSMSPKAVLDRLRS